VEHHPAREQHGEERKYDREERQTSQLKAHAGKQAESEGRCQANSERARGDGDGKCDHGTKR
jgi:hypothetical protein